MYGKNSLEAGSSALRSAFAIHEARAALDLKGGLGL